MFSLCLLAPFTCSCDELESTGETRKRRIQKKPNFCRDLILLPLAMKMKHNPTCGISTFYAGEALDVSYRPPL